ncbi:MULTISPECIES: flavin reductase family protein [unclassified Rhodococcus (in: high G+C Gram-positive bacteria)]|uniref:flavin reductase family protein n=1 Tax=unclassified Rhodococcus (in: high G+C Gram-positive bacteria) TaxID=192944 RepID=UPI00163A06E3|nr:MULTISPECIES: flavin reductase family protein [unclassified Rhodococcus (in: high G+C Gram-positive bacteria)]MBC2637917.1 flavin reductase family protein [Rhodococcus sp. 3A]MBC2897335.1 flavin reductase family protein [Rhodococcus sp. 4CII]
MIIDADGLDATAAYKLLIGSVVPRAIAWVSTVSRDGVGNVAPISFFTVVGRNPPTVSISLQPRSDGVTLKDTMVNIQETGEFVTNLATLPQAHQVHTSALEFDSEEDEFEALGLEKAPCKTISAPRIKGSPISFECVVDRIIPVGTGNETVVWGQIVNFHVRDDLYLERGRIDTAAVPVVGRLAAEYTLVNNVFSTPLGDDVVAAYQTKRMSRLDSNASDWSPIDTELWSPSGATTTAGKDKS